MRLKIKANTATDIFTLDDDSISVQELSKLISQSSGPLKGVQVKSYKLGFPPKTVDAEAKDSLKEAGFKPNEQLIAELGESSARTIEQPPSKIAKSEKAEADDIANMHISSLNEYAILRNVPDDNACLFNAISYALEGTFKLPDLNLRAIVADTIRNDPVTYDEMVLGRPLLQYCEWIEKSESWGGAIELGILASFLQVRINCFDVELGNLIVFQDEARKPSKFINLVYSGIHYDCIITNSKLTQVKTGDIGNWTTHEDDIVAACKSLVKCLQLRNYTTNTTKFRVRCLVCYEIVVGEMGASKHANNTGHYLFGEVK